MGSQLVSNARPKKEPLSDLPAVAVGEDETRMLRDHLAREAPMGTEIKRELPFPGFLRIAQQLRGRALRLFLPAAGAGLGVSLGTIRRAC